MKKHQLQTIARIRKLLTDRLHTGWAMVDTIKTNLDDTMSYEREIIMDDNRQMVQQIRIYDDATGEYREFTAPYIIASDDFRFSDIGLDETVFRSDPRLGYIPEDLPSWITLHIDWQAVWDCELCYDYFKFDGHYFRNL